MTNAIGWLDTGPSGRTASFNTCTPDLKGVRRCRRGRWYATGDEVLLGGEDFEVLKKLSESEVRLGKRMN